MSEPKRYGVLRHFFEEDIGMRTFLNAALAALALISSAALPARAADEIPAGKGS